MLSAGRLNQGTEHTDLEMMCLHKGRTPKDILWVLDELGIV